MSRLQGLTCTMEMAKGSRKRSGIPLLNRMKPSSIYTHREDESQQSQTPDPAEFARIRSHEYLQKGGCYDFYRSMVHI